MKPLEIHCRGKVLFARVSVQDKGLGMRDYTLHGKDGLSIYIFRKELGQWRCAYGELSNDVREACIDALILRFDRSVAEMFYHKGVRQIVEVSPHEHGVWHIFINNSYRASIQFDPFKSIFEYHFADNSLLDNMRMEKYIGMINRGEIKWIKGSSRI